MNLLNESIGDLTLQSRFHDDDDEEDRDRHDPREEEEEERRRGGRSGTTQGRDDELRLLQDESLQFGPGTEGLLPGEGGMSLLLGGDDSFFGDEVEEPLVVDDEATVRLGANDPVTRRNGPNEDGLEDEVEAEEEPSYKRERMNNEAGIRVEFGGSMAASKGSYGPSSTMNATGLSIGRAGAASQAQPPTEPNFGNGTVDDEADELLVLEDDNCSAEDKERIRQLRNERDELRGMNRVLSDVVLALKMTESKMTDLQSTANTSHELLDLYSRICSQAEHTKDLILDPEWKGLDADEQILFERQQALEQAQEKLRIEQEFERERLLQEARDREEKKRRELEDAKFRRTHVAASGTTTRGSGNGLGRGGGVSRGSTGGGRVLVRGTRARPTTITSSTRGSRIPNPSDSSSASFSSNSSGIPTFSSTSGRGSASVSGVRGVRGLRSRGGVSGIGRGRGQ